MRFINALPTVILVLASSVAIAEDKNCADLANPQARQECMQHKYGDDTDCSKFTNQQARKECLEHKQSNGNGVDCGKLANAEQRRECVKQKAK